MEKMELLMKKFGAVLNGRPAGREAALRGKQIINGDKAVTFVVIDFTGVEVLTPSFGDEFFSNLRELYPKLEIEISGYERNLALKETLKALRLISA